MTRSPALNEWTQRLYKDPANPLLGSYVNNPVNGLLYGLPDGVVYGLHTRGKSIKIKMYGATRKSRSSFSPRGLISSFTAAARNRLLHKLASIVALPGSFTTLTYHNHQLTAAESKVHLDTFLKRFKRRFPNSSLCWKLEYQKRGMPHYHMIVWFAPGEFPGPDLYRRWLSRTWWDVTGRFSDAHFKAGTQHIEPWGQWHRYLAKYVSKLDIPPEETHPGRFWGFHNRACVPFADSKNLYLSPSDWARVRRWCNRITKRKTNRISASFLMIYADTAQKITDWLISHGLHHNFADGVFVPYKYLPERLP